MKDIPDFSAANVLVVGDLMLDRYWHGDTSRISPEAPVPVVRVGEAEERPGGAGNVALNIAALGARVTLLGLTGHDEACDALKKILADARVDCDFEQVNGCATVTKLRVMSRHQQLIRLDFEDGFNNYNSTGLFEKFQRHLENTGAIVLSDYGKGTLRNIQKFIQLAHEKNIPVLIDPKGADFSLYKGATLITPNMSEFTAVVGECKNDDQVVQKGNDLIEQTQLDALLVTRSERGMTLLQHGKEPFHLPTQAQEVYDVTGAGDTVISVLATALAAGSNLQEATTLSNIGAGVVVSKLGTATVSANELKSALRKQQPVERGVVSEEQLKTLVKEAQSHGEKVVMTNGCFDILHPGHVSYLQQAGKLGDRLIIAVNDDASVKRLKGESRPINSIEPRMAVLAGLECVDWVVSFSEDTPKRLICNILPDILVKGGDYQASEIAGGECVIEHGGEVKVLDFIQGHSTSEIIKSILEN